MPINSSRSQGTSRTHPASPLPTTVWFPAPDQPEAAPAPGGVLPAWAIEKIRTEYTRRPGRRPAHLLKISIQDTAPGMDARTPCTTYTGSADGPGTGSGAALVLAELHPDTLPAPDVACPAAGSEMSGAMEDGWSGFFHRAHRLLPADGLLLLATRQRRDLGVLTDALGSLTACARTAGFRYLQHIVIAHAHPAGDRLVPAPLPDASPGVTHSDLIVLSPIHHA